MCAQCYALHLEHLDLIEDAIDRWNMASAEEIAAFTGLSEEEVQRVVRETGSLRRRVEIEHRCKKCRKEVAQKDSDYCLMCRLMLNQAFGLAADDMAQKTAVLSSSVKRAVEASGHGVASMLEDKRRRSNVKGRLTPKNRWSD